MTREYEYIDHSGQKFSVELEIDENSPAYERMVRHLANRARVSKRKLATIAGGAVRVKLKEWSVG